MEFRPTGDQIVGKGVIQLLLTAALSLPLAFAQSGGTIFPGGAFPLPAIPAYAGNVVSGPTVGPDGNAYLVRTIPATATAAARTELVAIGPANPLGNNIHWTLPVVGTTISEPAFGPAGSNLIYLTTSEPTIFPLMLGATMGTSPVAARKPALVIVTATPTSASAQRVEIAANTLSPPHLTADGSTIYVLAQASAMLSSTTPVTVTPSTATLYVFLSTGSVKFSVKLF